MIFHLWWASARRIDKGFATQGSLRRSPVPGASDNQDNKETSMAETNTQARTPGAKRAEPGEFLFELAKVNHILGGPDYSTANGACVEGDRMIVGLMRMPAGTGAQPHSHPNEQWIYILEGSLIGTVGDQTIEAKPGSLIYIPANTVHSVKVKPDADVLFFTVKDASHSLHGIKAG
jgi:quercetin dioxygenase-like cupin family protein